MNLFFKIKRRYYIFYNKVFFNVQKIPHGKNFKVYNIIYLEKCPSAKIKIGDNFVFSSGDFFNPLARNIRGGIFANDNAKISIGNNVGISSSCIWCNFSITIGDNVNIGADSIIMDTDAHSLCYLDRRDYAIDQKNVNNKKIVIEDDVLIGTRCIILKGVTIGARSIIGSGSVVTHDIPPDSIAAGNPCKIIRANYSTITS